MTALYSQNKPAWELVATGVAYLTDPRLSYSARGLAFVMVCAPDRWLTLDQLTTPHDCERDVLAALDELIAAGYAERVA